MLTKERCDELITIEYENLISWPSSIIANGFATSDEAELFAYRLLDAVKRARESNAE